MNFHKLNKLTGCLTLAVLGYSVPSFSANFKDKFKSISIAAITTHRSAPALTIFAGLAAYDFHRQSKKLKGYSFSKYAADTSSGVRKEKLGKAVQASGLLSLIAIGSDSVTAYKNRLPKNSAYLSNLKDVKNQIEKNLKLRKNYIKATEVEIRSLTKQLEAEKQKNGLTQYHKKLEKELFKYQKKLIRLNDLQKEEVKKYRETYRTIKKKLDKEIKKEKDRENGKSVEDENESELEIDEDVEDLDIDEISDCTSKSSITEDDDDDWETVSNESEDLVPINKKPATKYAYTYAANKAKKEDISDNDEEKAISQLSSRSNSPSNNAEAENLGNGKEEDDSDDEPESKSQASSLQKDDNKGKEQMVLVDIEEESDDDEVLEEEKAQSPLNLPEDHPMKKLADFEFGNCDKPENLDDENENSRSYSPKTRNSDNSGSSNNSRKKRPKKVPLSEFLNSQ
jgi:hypothetical protein